MADVKEDFLVTKTAVHRKTSHSLMPIDCLGMGLWLFWILERVTARCASYLGRLGPRSCEIVEIAGD